MLKADTARQWHYWRTDYRCQRPAVSCSGCGQHYAPHQSAGVMTFLGNNLVSCGNCEKPKPREKVDTPRPVERPEGIYPIPKKCVGRDVACRYIDRFDGRTHREPTAIDDYEVLLVNRHNKVIAKISSLDTFPKPVDPSLNDDIPF